ncbi:MAG: bifunctional riboflavin kinase/FAD synthetase [marine benthic group bacterium]|nr:bifunctional riboflavin kinase/FAD synthetase [Gemmatimonadota bacterium]
MTIEVHGGLESGLPPDVEGTVVTVGSFDGVHRGHVAVLEEITQRAAERGLHSVLVTFDRHPLSVVRPEAAPGLLTTPDEKKEILSQSGLDYVAFLPFTRALSQYGPEQFVDLVLRKRFRVAELVIGYDHGFGRGREGDNDLLRRLGRAHGFAVDVVAAVESGGSPVSSTRIRAGVANGDMERVGLDLGRPYSFRGPVVTGLGRGRDLGFPTANITAPGGGKLLPCQGIYAVRASLRTEIRSGLLHLGPRPTFAGSPPSIELYILDFDEDIYGERVRVDFLKRLRDVLPFGTAAELVEQMKKDRDKAREYFAGLDD